jgi:hypothetical protein
VVNGTYILKGKDKVYARPNPGLGDDSLLGGSFIGGSALTSLVLGIGVILLFKYLEKPHSRTGNRKKYVAYVSKQHKLSKKDQQWLMEHEE